MVFWNQIYSRIIAYQFSINVIKWFPKICPIDDEFGEKTVSVLLDGEETEMIFIDHPSTEMSVSVPFMLRCVSEQLSETTNICTQIHIVWFNAAHLKNVPHLQVENSLTTYEPHSCVVVYSVVQRNSFRQAEETINYLWREKVTNDKCVILVGNKVDLARSRVISYYGELWRSEL